MRRLFPIITNEIFFLNSGTYEGVEGGVEVLED